MTDPETPATDAAFLSERERGIRAAALGVALGLFLALAGALARRRSATATGASDR